MTYVNAPPLMLMLGYVIILALVQLVLHAALVTIELGLAYNLSARDDQRKPKGLLAQRATRAFHNLMETLPLFVAAALAAQVTGHTGGYAMLGAQLYFWSRVIYVPVYLVGIPAIRTLIWTVSVVGICLITAALFAPA